MSNTDQGKALAATSRRDAVRPPVDVHEDEQRITLRADLPGVASSGLHVAVDGNVLTIEAEASLETAKDMKVAYAEARSPYYVREFTLSNELDTGAIQAELRDGVLTLNIPKREHAKPRKIDVQAS
jgi:HSP20 family protein